jgi:hypothetical protein
MGKNTTLMKGRNVKYFTKSRAMKIIEQPMQADLQTFLSAMFALSRNRVVKSHIQKTLYQLNPLAYKYIALSNNNY